MTFEDVIRDLSSSYKCLSIFITGGAAKIGSADFSALRDIDLIVIQDGCDSFERQIEDINGSVYDISYISSRDLKLQSDTENPVWVSAIAKGKVIYMREGSQGKVDDIIRRASHIYLKGPEKPNIEKIKFIRYDIFESLEMLSDKAIDGVQFKHCAPVVLDKIIDYYFELNSVWQPKIKKKLATLKSEDILLFREIEEFYGLSDIKEKILALKDIANKVLLLHGGTLEKFEKGSYPLEK